MPDTPSSDPANHRPPNYLENLITRLSDVLQRDESSEGVLKFQPVTEDEFIKLAADNTRNRSLTKLQYHRPTELLLVKTMSEMDHFLVVALTRQMIDEKLEHMEVDDQSLMLVWPLDAGGGWLKEPDLCWAPRVSINPTFVVEVGTSESAHHLSTNARGWLEAPNSFIETVITISFDHLSMETSENPLTLFVWSRLSDDDTQNNPGPAVWIARIDVKRDKDGLFVDGISRDVKTRVLVETDEIRLPLEVFIGPQAEHGDDIVITNDGVLELFVRLSMLYQPSCVTH